MSPDDTPITAEAAPAELRAYMDNDLFVRVLGIRRESMTAAGCVCRMPLRADFQNGAGLLHGGAIFTLADYAGACLAVAQGCPAPTVNAAITFTAAVPVPDDTGGELVAVARLVRSGRNLVHVRVEVADGRGRDVAHYTATAFRLAPPKDKP